MNKDWKCRDCGKPAEYHDGQPGVSGNCHGFFFPPDCTSGDCKECYKCYQVYVQMKFGGQLED